MDIKFTLSLIVSFGALFFSFLTYRRSRRMENENHLYKLKIEVYSKLISELNNLLNVLVDNYSHAQLYINNPTDPLAEELNKQADELDNLCLKFDDFIIANSLIIPEKVLNPLKQFSDKIIETEGLDEAIQDDPNAIVKLKKIIDHLSDEAEKINEQLRIDLQIEKLNSALYSRIK